MESTARKIDSEAEAQRVIEPLATARGRGLLVVAFAAIVGAMFLPAGGVMGTVLSVGWIFAVCLFAAVVMIVAAAKNVGQLRGFAGLVALSVVVREVMGIASVKMIYFEGECCLLFARAAEIVGIDGGLGWMIGGAGIVGATGAAVWGGRRIMLRASNVAVNSIPYKFISTDADMNAGLISEEQAGEIKQRIADEARFYLSTAAVSKLLLFDIGISVLCVLGAGVAAAGGELAGPDEIAAMGMEVTGAGAQVLMMAAAMLGPGALTVVLCARLVGKKEFELVSDEDERAAGFSVHEGDAAARRVDAEVLNPDFAEVAQKRLAGGGEFDLREDVELGEFDENELTASAEETAAEIGDEREDLAAILGEAVSESRVAEGAAVEEFENSGGDDEAAETEIENAAEEVSGNGREVISDVEEAGDADGLEEELAVDGAVTDAEGDEGDAAEGVDFYDVLVAEVDRAGGGKAGVLLLGGDGFESMPVTSVVNAGFRMAGEDRRCVVIDADYERRAVAEAFDAEGDSVDQPVRCCMENLWVWTVRPDVGNLGVDIAGKIEAAREQFDGVIVYAPCIRDDAYFGKLAGMVDVAVLGGDASEGYLAELQKLLEAMGCRCLEGGE